MATASKDEGEGPEGMMAAVGNRGDEGTMSDGDIVAFPDNFAEVVASLPQE
ncbi:hypothetical protein ACP4OV_018139 [Aristida adscensionis]